MSKSNKKNHKKSSSKAKSNQVSSVESENLKVTSDQQQITDEEASSHVADDVQMDHTDDQASPIRVQFPYSDVVRSYVPDAMAIADKALIDWKSEGSFMNLGIENPYANMAVSLSLQNAKKIEKKLEEKGVLPVVRMGFEVLKSKVSKQK